MEIDPIPYDEMPFSSDKVDELLRQADLSKLLKGYTPSKLSREATKKQKRTKEARKLRSQDILCGRGNHITKLPGNTLMRYAMIQNQEQYFELSPKGVKKIAADAIIGLFESWDMLFLEANDPTHPLKSTSYRVCSYERASEKVMQSLRQKIFKNQKHVNPIQQSQKTFDEKILSKAQDSFRKLGYSPSTKKASKGKAAPHKAARKTKAPKPKDHKKLKHSAPTKVTPDEKKRRKPKRSKATSSTEATDNSPRCVTKVAPIHVTGTFEQPIAAPVLCLAAFLRSKLESKLG